jgi:hypothetical protein
MTAPEAAAGRIDELLRSHPGPVTEELTRNLVEFYGAGLARIAALLGPERVRELCADPLVESLLLVHDLHPVPAGERIRLALTRAGRPPAKVDIDGDAVRVWPAAGGCGVAPEIEAVVRRVAPEMSSVVVEGPPPPLLQVGLRPGLARPPAMSGGFRPAGAPSEVRLPAVIRPAGSAGAPSEVRPAGPVRLPQAAPSEVRPAALVRLPQAAAGARCEMCGADLGDRHAHLAELDERSLRCVCRPCGLLFAPAGAGGGRLRAVPERYLTDPAHPIAAADWDLLQIPAMPAFLFENGELGRVIACYPSPAGATESLLDLDGWTRLRETYPLLRVPAADVEAVYVTRADAGLEAYLVPIDACFSLVGRIRLNWRGPDGGATVRAALAAFRRDLQARSRPITPTMDPTPVVAGH